MTRALVTGASGLLGSHMVEVLLNAGVEVRAFVRPTSDTRQLEMSQAEIIYGDASHTEVIRQAVIGVDWIYHIAGYLTASSPFTGSDDSNQYQAVNVDFSETLLNAASDADIVRFIYASSSSVYDIEAPVPTAEDAPLRPISKYGRSKLEAEKRVRAYQARGLPTTIIRPPIIYGPGDRYFSPVAMRLARLPVLPLVGGGRNLIDLVYVRDVADLMLQASHAEAAIGKVYNAGPAAPASLRELVHVFRQLTGHAPRIVPIPLATLRPFAWLARWFVASLAPSAKEMLTPTGLAIMSRDIHLDISRARIELKYSPRFDLMQGLASTLPYYE